MMQYRMCREGGPSDFRSSPQAAKQSHRKWKGRCRLVILAFAGTVKRAFVGHAGTALMATTGPRGHRNVR
jgi:hypothetical protein